MPFVIDAHQDLAYNALTFGRDIRRSAFETRRMEAGSQTEVVNGHALLGWPEYQQGQVGLVFASLFVMPRRHKSGLWENQDYGSFEEAYRLTRAQVDYYQRLCEESAEMFQLVRNQTELAKVLQPWIDMPANPPEKTHPVGILLSMEGAEGVSGEEELIEWWEAGLRIIGPVWAGTRLCGGMYEPGRFTKEGLGLLEIMADLGYTVDIAHMSEESALQALDIYPGRLISSHTNASALLKGENLVRRHLSDRVIRLLAEREGVIGVMPFNRFLLAGWQNHEPRERVRLEMLVDHIDHICQVTGSVLHTGIGSDFDGGFGWPAIPLEMETIADLQKLAVLLAERGFSQENIEAIFHGNWQRILEQTLPG